MTVKCERCGAMNRDNVSTCIECGAPLSIPRQEQQMVYQKACINCNRMINASLGQCPYCGANQTLSPYNQYATAVAGTHNKVIAAVLAFFLGSFGAHKFYLGQGGQGILYLLFFWTFIPAIVSIIEAIIYLSMSDIDFAKKYHKF
jgi:TM2 domain-containing membrane protein YozV/RNA polymerase subunit RPABC4/transcription elongation factor Spt4